MRCSKEKRIYDNKGVNMSKLQMIEKLAKGYKITNKTFLKGKFVYMNDNGLIILDDEVVSLEVAKWETDGYIVFEE